MTRCNFRCDDRPRATRVRATLGWSGTVCFVVCVLWFMSRPLTAQSVAAINARVQDKIVKIFGAGGVRGLEAYQSGILISDEGHILTAWSYVLDTEYITAVLSDGRRLQAELVGADPRLEIAVLRVDATGLPYFAADQDDQVDVGDFVLAFGNLYGIASGREQASLLHGVVSAIAPLAARRGVYETPYDGKVYVVDAMTNNAGAAGGALTDQEGRLVGVLGKELRSSLTNVWLNYALPIQEVRPAVQDILEGRQGRRDRESVRRPEDPLTLAQLGIVLIPQILAKTPAYVERVVRGSPAELSGVRADDLIVMLDGQLTQSRGDVIEQLSYVDRLDAVRLTLMRGNELIEVELAASSAASTIVSPAANGSP